MITALTGTISEPVMRNSSTSVARHTRPTAYGQPARQSLLHVGQLRGRSPDLDVEGHRVVGSDPVDHRGRRVALRGARRDQVHDAQARMVGRAGSRLRGHHRSTTPASSQVTKAGSLASAAAMTVTGSVPRAGKRSEKRQGP